MPATRLATAALVSALLAGALIPACRRPSDPESVAAEEAHSLRVADHPASRPFRTLKLRWATEVLRLEAPGESVLQSSGTTTTVIDAVANKFRMELKPASEGGQGQLIIFDGKKFWTVYPEHRVASAEPPPWKDYKVWDQGRPYVRAFVRKESLRGLEVNVMKADKSTFWIYKGVIVQSDRRSRDLVIRNVLQDIREDEPVDPEVFEIPAGYRRVEPSV